MGFEDITVPLRIGVVEEKNEFLSRMGKVGEEVAISLWREVYIDALVNRGDYTTDLY